MAKRKVTKSAPIVAGALQSVVWGFGRLPLPLTRRFARLIGNLLWRLPNQFRATSLRNIQRCYPDLKEDARQRIVRESLISLSLNIVEAGAMFHWSRDQLESLNEELVGREVMEAAVAQGRGVLALGPHIGNWEYLSHVVGTRWGMTALYRPPRIAELDAYLRRSRQHLGGTDLVPADARGLRRVARALRAGEVVGILPDQEPLKENGVFAPFFGVPALTMTLVCHLIRKFDPVVVYGFSYRTPSGRFRSEVFEAQVGLGDQDLVRAATLLNQGVERCVLVCPDQYMWSYRRFRTRPPEELAARTDLDAEDPSSTAAR